MKTYIEVTLNVKKQKSENCFYFVTRSISVVIWALSFLIPVFSELLKNGLALHVCGVEKGGAGSPGAQTPSGIVVSVIQSSRIFLDF